MLYAYRSRINALRRILGGGIVGSSFGAHIQITVLWKLGARMLPCCLWSFISRLILVQPCDSSSELEVIKLMSRHDVFHPISPIVVDWYYWYYLTSIHYGPMNIMWLGTVHKILPVLYRSFYGEYWPKFKTFYLKEIPIISFIGLVFSHRVYRCDSGFWDFCYMSLSQDMYACVHVPHVSNLTWI